MGFTQQSINVQSITPEKAADFLTLNFKRNRPPRMYYVDYLASEMASGRFLPTAEIHIMYCNGEPSMINGQHTCLAIMKHGKPVRVTVRQTSTNEPGQVNLFYALGHDNGIRRTSHDQVNAYGVSEQTGLTTTQVNAVASSLRFMRNGFTNKAGNRTKSLQSPAELAESIVEWSPYANRYFMTISEKDKNFSRLTLKSGCLSVALATMRYDPAAATSFWETMARPENLSWDHPAAVARRTLETSKGQGHKSAVTAEKLSRQMARCWQGFLTDETMKIMPRIVDDYAPIRILKTPWTGKHPAPPFMPENETD